jgi:hypothetical protein
LKIKNKQFKIMKKLSYFSLIALFSLLTFNSFAQTSGRRPTAKEIDSLRNVIGQFKDAQKLVDQRLIKFDTLDFEVFSNQEWERLHESHSDDIKVYWPDGHLETGIDVHIASLKQLFVYAPDTPVKMHPIRFGSGNLTVVTGVFEGTFTKPMPIGNGKFIQPTGKAFKMPMATIGIWGPDGKMHEEYLFWDNKTYIDQIGLGK